MLTCRGYSRPDVLGMGHAHGTSRCVLPSQQLVLAIPSSHTAGVSTWRSLVPRQLAARRAAQDARTT